MTKRLLKAHYELAVVLLLGLFSPVLARADDSAVMGVGGALRPMQEHPSIRMVTERVVIDMDTAKAEVDCLFHFKNEGPATTVRMGFPESGGGDVDVDNPEGFTYFNTWVDGRRVPARIEGMEKGPAEWSRWRVKSVKFASGQTRLVRVRYSAPLGNSVGGNCGFSYRLDTGASWKGPIGRVDIIARLRNFPKYWTVTGGPAGFRRYPSGFSWHWENLEPGAKLAAGKPAPKEVSIGFIYGYYNIIFNGKPINPFRLTSTPAELRGVRLWASINEFAEWVKGGTDYHDGALRASFTCGGHTIMMQANRHQVLLDGKPAQLQSAPRLRQADPGSGADFFVPVSEIVRLLGGTAHLDKKSGTTYLTLPESKKGNKQ
jgi:hypothetical protein